MATNYTFTGDDTIIEDDFGGGGEVPDWMKKEVERIRSHRRGQRAVDSPVQGGRFGRGGDGRDFFGWPGPGGDEFGQFDLPGMSPGGPSDVSQMSLGGILDQFFQPEYERINERLPGLEDEYLGGLRQRTDLNNPFLQELQNRFGITMDEAGSASANVGAGNVAKAGDNRFLDTAFEFLNDPDKLQDLSGGAQEVARGVTDQLFQTGGEVDQATQEALRSSVASGFGARSGGFDNARMNILQRASGTAANAAAQTIPQLFQTAVSGSVDAGTDIRGQDTRANIASAQNRARLEAANLDAQMAGNQLQGQMLQTLGSVGTGLAGLTLEDRLKRLQGLGGFTAGQQELSNDLRQSLFGGRATEFNQEMAQEQMDLNRKAIEQALQESGCGIGDRIAGGLGGALGGASAGSALPGPGNIIGAGAGLIGGIFGGC